MLLSCTEMTFSLHPAVPWKLPPSLVKDLVAYAVARLNIWHTMALNRNVCLKVLFTGLCVYYKKELSLHSVLTEALVEKQFEHEGADDMPELSFC